MGKHSGCSGLESFAGPERRAWNRDSMWSFTNSSSLKTSNAKFMEDNGSPHDGRMDAKRSQKR